MFRVLCSLVVDVDFCDQYHGFIGDSIIYFRNEMYELDMGADILPHCSYPWYQFQIQFCQVVYILLLGVKL